MPGCPRGPVQSREARAPPEALLLTAGACSRQHKNRHRPAAWPRDGAPDASVTQTWGPSVPVSVPALPRLPSRLHRPGFLGPSGLAFWGPAFWGPSSPNSQAIPAGPPRPPAGRQPGGHCPGLWLGSPPHAAHGLPAPYLRTFKLEFLWSASARKQTPPSPSWFSSRLRGRGEDRGHCRGGNRRHGRGGQWREPRPLLRKSNPPSPRSQVK